MNVEFKNKELVKLYVSGKSTKYSIPLNTAELFVLRVFQLKSAHSIKDIKKTKFFNFFKPVKLKNTFRINICNESKLEFQIEWLDDKETVGTIFITDLIFD